MHRDEINAIWVGLIMSAIDWPIMAATERWRPHLPSRDDLNRGESGTPYHSGKDWWTEAFRRDAQWWSKFARFVSWWLTACLIFVA